MVLVGVITCPISHYKASHRAHTDKVAPTKEQLKAYARSLYSGDEIQFECLDALWTIESHWNPYAKGYRTSQGQAIGIAQALPADKMSVIGLDYMSNPYTQIKWGLLYIKLRYNNRACWALRFELNHNYY